MDPFIKQRLAQVIRQSMAQADRAWQGGNIEAAKTLCDQILARDHTAVGPWVLATKQALAVGKWDTALHSALHVLKTRPEFEGSGFDAGLDVTYEEVAGWLDEAAEELLTSLAAGPGDPQQQVLAWYSSGVARHIQGDLDAARDWYEKVTLAGMPAKYIVGNTINLLHALEHEAGNPDAAKRWLDLETFPIALHARDVIGDDYLGFLDGLYDEVISSPKLEAFQDMQSRNWNVADKLNEDEYGSAIARLEDVFSGVLRQHRPIFERQAIHFVQENFEAFPESHRVQLFSAVVKGAGHVGPHVHSDCYLVGNLYVRVPDEQGTDVAAIEGAAIEGAAIEGAASAAPRHAAIHYGKHLLHAATGGGYPTRRIEPEPGTMLLWPAFYSHGTEPSLAEGVRMVVGFDVIPERAAA